MLKGLKLLQTVVDPTSVAQQMSHKNHRVPDQQLVEVLRRIRDHGRPGGRAHIRLVAHRSVRSRVHTHEVVRPALVGPKRRRAHPATQDAQLRTARLYSPSRQSSPKRRWRTVDRRSPSQWRSSNERWSFFQFKSYRLERFGYR